MKPKIIQNSKDMLSRGFNPAKCKTALKLATSRLKLLRNKKEVQLKQMKREIALLLDSGQDQTARIRVEHVIREEKMMAAYDLLSIYCELIVARLPIIESQKNCPIDLKEAIASVLFASPRCGDVPELMDIKKHLTAKYGKDFTASAIELRPQCGVGRLLIEKLSAISPDGQTKIKILTMIAQEHNIPWTSMSLDAKDLGPCMDLLVGPSAPGTGGIPDAGPSRFETAEVKPHMDSNMWGSLSNSSMHVPGPSVEGKKPETASTSGIRMMTQSTERPSVEDRAHPLQGDGSNSFLDKQQWNFEFKDAASAAQAAFEYAERASVAARAVAALSTHERVVGTNCSNVPKPNLHVQGHEGPQTYCYSKTSSEKVCGQFGNEDISSFGNAGLSNKTTDFIEHSDPMILEDVAPGILEISRRCSSKLGVSAFKDPVDQEVTQEQGSPLHSPEEVPVDAESSQKYSSGTVIGRSAKPEDLRVNGIGNLHSGSSSDSEPEDVNIFAVSDDMKVENDASRDPFLRIGDGGSIYEDASNTSSVELAGIFFDKFDSDRDDRVAGGPVYDLENHEFGIDSPVVDNLLQGLPLKEPPLSPKCMSENMEEATSTVLFSRQNSYPELPETLMSKNGPEWDNLGPATFDGSDGFDSEGDEKTKTSHLKVVDPSELSEQNEFVHSGLYAKQMQRAPDEWKSEEMFSDGNIRRSDSPEKLSQSDILLEKPALYTEDVNMYVDGFDNDGSPVGVGRRLNFGKLTGGFRHKHNNLAFLMNQLSVSVEKKDVSTIEARRSDIPPPHFTDYDFEGTCAEYLDKTSKHEIYSVPTAKELNTTSSSLGASDPNNNSDCSNRYEDPPERMEMNTSSTSGAEDPNNISEGTFYEDPAKRWTLRRDLEGVLSGRTKASPLTFETNSYSKLNFLSQSEPGDSDGLPANSPDISTVGAGITSSEPGYKLETQDIDVRLRAEHPRSKQLKNVGTGHFSQRTMQKVIPEPMNSKVPVSSQMLNAVTASSRKQDALFAQKPHAVGKPSSPEQKPTASTVSGAPETPKYNEASGDKHGSTKRTSHVHPKLPDYDSLVRSLRRSQS